MKPALKKPSASSGKRNRHQLIRAQQVRETSSDDQDDSSGSTSSNSEDHDGENSSDERSRSRASTSPRGEGIGYGPRTAPNVLNAGGGAQWTIAFIDQFILNFNGNGILKVL